MRSLAFLISAFLVGACSGTALQFRYAVLQKDAAGVVSAPPACEDAGVFAVRFMVGDDLNQNLVLDNEEVIEEATRDCNQRDDNGDGVLAENELGLFTAASFSETEYGLFALELRDIEGQPVQFTTFDSTTDATRFSFGGGLQLKRGVNNIIEFNGDASQLAGELQIFVQ